MSVGENLYLTENSANNATLSRLAEEFSAKPRRQTWRRLLIASIVVVVLHFIFFFWIAPYLELSHTSVSRTEVVEISAEQLEKLKKKILNSKQERSALLQNELHEEFKSKEAPKDARMLAPFNQVVPKETVAGAQADAPREGSGGKSKSEPKPKSVSHPEKLELSKLGLGKKIAPPRSEPQNTDSAQPSRQGPPGPHRPVGRDDKSIQKGEDNLLNAVESEYYSFFVRLEEPIIRNWFFLARTNERQISAELVRNKIKAGSEIGVTIELAIDQQGNFDHVSVVESSSIPTFDQVTRESVAKLGSLPNPPPGLFKEGPLFIRRLYFIMSIPETPVSDSAPNLYW